MSLTNKNDHRQFTYLFGPVPSRRLGISLGIDMVPYKTCTFNCAYCECGKTTLLTSERREYIPANKLINEIDLFLKEGRHIDVLTFAGSGEPTLNSALDEVIQHVTAHYPALKTAVLTNGSTLTLRDVRKSLMAIDYVLPSLDAVSQEVFEKINAPAKKLSSREIIEGLTLFSQEFAGTLWVEVFIVPGINDTEQELTLLKEVLQEIGPDRVQLNSLDRPGAFDWVDPVSGDHMHKIADFFLPLPVEIISRKAGISTKVSLDTNDTESILQTLKRRPLTVEDLAVSFKNSINATSLILEDLVQKKRIITEKVGNKVFYRTL